MDLTWKVTIWYYTAVGAALIYFFDHLNETSPGYLPLILVFLSILSGGLSIIFMQAIPHLNELEELFDDIASRLRLPGRPHVEFIRVFFRLAYTAFTLIAGAFLAFTAYLYS
jgi:hypothetical protein